MANQENNLFEAIGQNFYNSVYSGLTGKPIPGSSEALQAEIEKQTKLKQLEDLKRNPNDPKALERVIAGLKQVQSLGLEGRKAEQALNMETLGAKTLLDARGRLTDESIRKQQAATQDEINLFDAKSQRQRQILGDITGHELALAGHDAGAMDKVLAFYSAAQDKNLAAQAEARKPNVLSLLAGLGATAASLFA